MNDPSAVPQPAQQLAGRRILVTGASSGIGAGVANEALRRGALVAGVGRRRERLEALSGLAAITADLTDPAAATAAVLSATEQLGGLDVVVNAAGINRPGLVTATTHEDWSAMFATNVLAVLSVSQTAIPALLAGNDPVIVNISSTSGLRVLSAQNGVYAATKAALRSVSASLRLELEGAARVVDFAPGYVRDTDIHRDYEPEHRREADQRQRDFGMDLRDVAALIVDLIAQPAGIEVNELVVTKPGYGHMNSYSSGKPDPSAGSSEPNAHG
ncbi:MAG: SDR family oxidoreductase [Microthrixaceae bacterium]